MTKPGENDPMTNSEIVLQNIETSVQEMAKAMVRLTSQTTLLDAALAVLTRHDLLGEFSAELSNAPFDPPAGLPSPGQVE
jgi:hypothetical protein